MTPASCRTRTWMAPPVEGTVFAFRVARPSCGTMLVCGECLTDREWIAGYVTTMNYVTKCGRCGRRLGDDHAD